MSAVVMDGKALAARIKEHIRVNCTKLPQPPSLAVVLVGDDPASAVYVRNKERDCSECGIACSDYRLPVETTQEELLCLVNRLNRDKRIDGILVQMPLPAHLNGQQVLEAIAPEKDVDAFHPENVGRILLGRERYLPCTPAGIMALLREYGIDPAGKKVAVIGRSLVIGKPVAMLLLARNATVTICHSRTRDLAETVREAEIVICATGRARAYGADFFREGQTVVDVGINVDAEGKLCGDVDFESVENLVDAITPVPRGVGSVTSAVTVGHTVQAAERALV